ncbi:AraC family transcriptional regulator [Paenibacillus aceti]|uniref:AraC family transcriptional regulator n=2 Tax=Paenibacillus aceti TaxID=1820010 RepID=A0ABQ1VNF8_9BACL|nr:AraC family transcriptional regulator [Paenibacillus aceti]GGF83631.1 AraC family transcriptional regulator [Paenibacillus aceti]
MISVYQNWNMDAELPLVIHRIVNLSFYPHFHNEIEFVYVEKGEMVVGVNEERRLLRAGDMVICCSNDIHYYESKDAESEVFMLICKPELIGTAKSWPVDFRFASPFIDSTPSELSRVRHLMLQILQEKESAITGYPMYIKSYLLELFGTLCRHLPTVPFERSSNQRFESKRAKFQQIITFIEANYSLDLSVEMMSERFEMNPSHFCRSFKKVIGMNFKTYLNTIRVLMAEHMLVNTHASITDIALECGFGSIRTFNRVYKELKGCSPSDTRSNIH